MRTVRSTRAVTTTSTFHSHEQVVTSCHADQAARVYSPRNGRVSEEDNDEVRISNDDDDDDNESAGVHDDADDDDFPRVSCFDFERNEDDDDEREEGGSSHVIGMHNYRLDDTADW